MFFFQTKHLKDLLHFKHQTHINIKSLFKTNYNTITNIITIYIQQYIKHSTSTINIRIKQTQPSPTFSRSNCEVRCAMKPFRFLDIGAYDGIPQEASSFWNDLIINLPATRSPKEPRPDPHSPLPWN